MLIICLCMSFFCYLFTHFHCKVGTVCICYQVCYLHPPQHFPITHIFYDAHGCHINYLCSQNHNMKDGPRYNTKYDTLGQCKAGCKDEVEECDAINYSISKTACTTTTATTTSAAASTTKLFFSPQRLLFQSGRQQQ